MVGLDLRVFILLAVSLLFALGGCAGSGSRGGPIPYGVSGFDVPDPPQAALLEADYQIAPGDTLAITVFQVESLSRDYRVDLAGNISLPLIGVVPAVGTTTAELQTNIAERLGQRYMRNPDVTVAVTESAARNITVDGSVREPGVFPVRGSMSLIQAVALARGLDEFANPRRVAIFRRVEGQRMAAAFDMTSIRQGEEPDPEIYAGDIIVVDGSRVRSAWREIFTALPVLSLFRPY